MKRYYYQVVKVGRERVVGGMKVGNRYVYADVFVVKNNRIAKLGQVRWNNAGNKGEESEVYEFLYKKGLVGKREYSNNRGYYFKTKSKVEILEIGG